jgi:hypothetical protein
MNRWSSTLKASLLGGLAAGAVAAPFTLVIMEPTIRAALRVEDGRHAVSEHGTHLHDHALVGRGTQVMGGLLAVLVTALLLSLAYSVVLARVRQRSQGNDLRNAMTVAGAFFVVFGLVPGLRYPGNPPAVGDPETVDERTLLYAGSLVIGALTVLAVAAVNRSAKAGGWSSTRRTWVIAVVISIAAVVVFAGLPASPDAIPSDVPAGLIWEFRLKSLGLLATIWAVMGLVAGTRLETKTTHAPEPQGLRQSFQVRS